MATRRNSELAYDPPLQFESSVANDNYGAMKASL